jgi:peptide/nickel transport system substrate-binding protein
MKSQKLIKVLALVLVAAFATIAFAACTKSPETSKSDATKSGSSKADDAVLVVAYDQFSEKFSPFFASTSYDQDVVGMTQLGTMTTTRTGAVIYNAIEGEDEAYNGTTYHYTGAADVALRQEGQGTDAHKTIYTIKLRNDLKFSDGQPVTIDDVIFSMYVIIDPYYTGSSTLGSIDIVGLQEYMYNNSEIGKLDVAAYIADIANKPELQQYIVENIITPTLTDELDWVKGSVLTDVEKYAPYGITADTTPGEGLYIFYGLDSSYDAKAHTEAEVLAELIKQYGFGEGALKDADGNGNYVALANAYAGDPTYFDGDVAGRAKILGAQELLASGVGQPVPNVAGFNRIDDYTLEVTTNGYAANAIYQVCSQTITPKHYYGDNSLYNYANNQFGFENRTEEGMKRVGAKNNNPMGAGPYMFDKYENGIVYFKANPNYYKGEPIIKLIQFKETPSKDKIAALATGDVDVAQDVTGSVDKFKEIAGYNKDTNDATGDTITSSIVWNLGYGYVGICADTVRVGSDGGSTESKNLRKALATLLAVHREATIASYYGEAAAVIEYPISSTSWAAPQISDAGYSIAYSKDVTGAPIYTSDMSADAKLAAAINAAKGFLQAAGYTWDEASQKFTAAPSGAKMSYELTLPGGGVGDHPAFQIATQAAADLATLGLELKINDVSDANVLWNGLEAGTIELWAAAWGSTIDPDMYQVYHSASAQGGSGSNHYRIKDANLDALITAARQSDDQTFRRTTYKQCLDIILDWAVEVPTYQRRNLVCFSTKRIDINSLTPDITTYWGWMSEIETLKINK